MKLAAAALFLVLAGTPALAAECGNGTSKEEVKACLSQELRDSDQRINAVYKNLMDSRDADAKLALRKEQRAWLKQRDSACGLNNKESDREKWLQTILADDAKTVCVVRYTFARLGALNDQLSRTEKSTSVPTAPHAPRFESKTVSSTPSHVVFGDDGYQLTSLTAHATGKWYFELWIDRSGIAKAGDVLLSMGVRGSQKSGAVQLVNVRHTQTGATPVNVAMAIDLDNGAIYIRVNGEWRAAPGSNGGLELKLNQDYRAFMLASSQLSELLQRSLLKVNLGGQPFAYAMPDGYRPFDEK